MSGLEDVCFICIVYMDFNLNDLICFMCLVE